MTTGITDVEWLDAKVCELSDALDRLAASLAAKDAEIANLRADLKVKEIATDEAMAQGERQRAQIEGLREALDEAVDHLDHLWSFVRVEDRDAIGPAIPQRIAVLGGALSQSPADLLARREAERELFAAAGHYVKTAQGHTSEYVRENGRHGGSPWAELVDAVARVLYETFAKGFGDTAAPPFSDAQRAMFESLAAAAVATYRAWLDAHGWQIVPKEPTADMLWSGVDTAAGLPSHSGPKGGTPGHVQIHGAWDAMLAAAPKPPGD